MPQQALAGTLAVYLVLAVLLLSLNLTSLWRWWIKASAIVIALGCFIGAYFAITGLIGWPTFTPLPQRFNLVGTRIIEPDKLNGAEGHVYLWVEELNANNVPIGAPRGYEMPYTSKLADQTADAQTRLSSGKQILGETASEDSGSGSNSQTGKSGQQSGQQSNTTGSGAQLGGQSTAAESVGQAALVTFSDMPPVTLPDKAAIVIPP